MSGELLGIEAGERWCSPKRRRGAAGGGGAAVAYNKVYAFMRSSECKQGRTGRGKEGEEVE